MNQLAVIENKTPSIWEGDENLRQIRELFAPTLTEKEFIVYVEMGKRTGLNPFLKEIWAVKFDPKRAANIFIGRDGYRKGAQRHPLYDFHSSDAVYSNDEFGVDNGKVLHRYKLKDRGNLVGAYCLVQRKGSSRATYVYVELKEYDLKQSVWKDKPATMIKKVAEAQALRMAFQELFAGTLSEYEQYEQQATAVANTRKGVKGLKEKLGIATESEPEIIDDQTGEIIDSESEIEMAQTIIEQEIEEVEDSSFHAIEILMEGATSTKELMDAMKMAKDFNAEDKRKVSLLFNKRQADLKR